MSHPEYQRGWSAAIKYVNEQRRLDYEAKGIGGASALAFAIGMYVVILALACLYGLIVRGEWHPWFFMLSLGGAVWMIYLIRSDRRGRAKLAEKRREFENRWK